MAKFNHKRSKVIKNEIMKLPVSFYHMLDEEVVNELKDYMSTDVFNHINIPLYANKADIFVDDEDAQTTKRGIINIGAVCSYNKESNIIKVEVFEHFADLIDKLFDNPEVFVSTLNIKGVNKITKICIYNKYTPEEKEELTEETAED